METRIIDGKQIAASLKAETAEEIRQLREEGKRIPKLSVIMVGDNPASEVYVRNKKRACDKAGMLQETILLDAGITQEELLKRIEQLNGDPQVDGILVQMPLPDGFDEELVKQTVSSRKDVDGFHFSNTGMLAAGKKTGFIPCTPLGIIEILKRENISISGKHCVIVGRSNLVGKPEAMLMLNEDATVTICHSKTKNLAEFTRQADILVAAVGRPELITGDMIKEGAVILDVGINRLEKGLTGDVDLASCLGKAAAITPVPGGVGPMTIAMLLKNTMQAYHLHEETEKHG